MEINKEFLLAEISDLELEINKAQAYAIKAQGVIEAYQMLIRRLETTTEEQV